MDLDKLSYRAYGNIVIVVLLSIALLFNLFPFSLKGLIMCVIQIPIYLIVRGNFKGPIHANGLNICFFLTILFYILLFLIIKLSFLLIGNSGSFILSTILCILGCYATSTMPNSMELRGKLFFGDRKSKNYQKLINYIKFNPSDNEIIKYKANLKEFNRYRYFVFVHIFEDRLTWDETMDKLDIDDRKTLDKEIYAIYSTLEYVLGLKD
ncbi:MAG: hypothetical protein RR847_04930 [Bacilli bacterium]